MIEVANSTSTTLAGGDVIPFTTVNFDTNTNASFNTSENAIVISKVGKYEVNGSFVFAPTDAGDSTITAYANGTAIPFDNSEFTAVATNKYTFTLPQKIINVVRSTSGNTVKITFATDVAGTLINAVASVKYIE